MQGRPGCIACQNSVCFKTLILMKRLHQTFLMAKHLKLYDEQGVPFQQKMRYGNSNNHCKVLKDSSESVKRGTDSRKNMGQVYDCDCHNS